MVMEHFEGFCKQARRLFKSLNQTKDNISKLLHDGS